MNPVLYRRVRWETSHWMLPAMVTVAGLFLLFVEIEALGDFTRSGTHRRGYLFNEAVAVGAYGYCLFFGLLVPALTFTTITREREGGTLDQLLVSPLTVREVVVGNIAAAMAPVLLLIGLSLPFTTSFYIHGGLDLYVVLGAYTVVPVWAFLLACLGVSVSALVRRTWQSAVVTFAAFPVLSIVTFIMSALVIGVTESMRGRDVLGLSADLLGDLFQLGVEPYPFFLVVLVALTTATGPQFAGPPPWPILPRGTFGKVVMCWFIVGMTLVDLMLAFIWMANLRNFPSALAGIGLIIAFIPLFVRACWLGFIIGLFLRGIVWMRRPVLVWGLAVLAVELLGWTEQVGSLLGFIGALPVTSALIFPVAMTIGLCDLMMEGATERIEARSAAGA